MRNLVNFILSIVILLSCEIPLCAQSENLGIVVNNGGIITNHLDFVNKATGSYNGINGGTFEHAGQGAGAFSNDGVYECTSGHTDLFASLNGDGVSQDIGGLVRPKFYNLTLSNGSTGIINVTNLEGICVGNQLKFENGITNTSRSTAERGSIRLEAGSSYVGGESDVQHVNGYVTKKGNSAFKFPVGAQSDIRTLEMGAPVNIETEVSVAWLSGDPSVTEDPSDAVKFHSVASVKGAIRKVNKSGQWDWIPVVHPENPILIKASIPNVSEFSQSSGLRLVGWDGTGWTDLSSGPSATGASENSLVSGIIPVGVTISAIGIGSVDDPLPVTLASFSASPIDDHFVSITWTTSLEVNSSHFEIEHSVDARAFELLTRIDAQNNQTGFQQHYSFLDHLHPRWGRHYYRLKMVDFDGTFTFSKIQTVELPNIGLVVSPNPASDKLVVTIGGEVRTRSIEIYDHRGVKIYSEQHSEKINHINTAAFSSGSYMLVVNYDNMSRETKSFVLVH